MSTSKNDFIGNEISPPKESSMFLVKSSNISSLSTPSAPYGPSSVFIGSMTTESMSHLKSSDYVESYDIQEILSGSASSNTSYNDDVSPKDQQLYRVKDGKFELLEDNATLADAGFNSSTARAQQPALIAMAFREKEDNFETCTIDPVSKPPPLPDVMRSGQTDAGSSQKHDEQTI